MDCSHEKIEKYTHAIDQSKFERAPVVCRCMSHEIDAHMRNGKQDQYRIYRKYPTFDKIPHTLVIALRFLYYYL